MPGPKIHKALHGITDKYHGQEQKDYEKAVHQLMNSCNCSAEQAETVIDKQLIKMKLFLASIPGHKNHNDFMSAVKSNTDYSIGRTFFDAYQSVIEQLKTDPRFQSTYEAVYG